MKANQLLLTGSLLRMFVLLANILVAFFLMPFVIHSLGDRWYGLWVVVGSVVGYFGVLDFGLSAATQRYVAHALPRNNAIELNRVVVTTGTILSGVSVIILSLTAIIVAIAPYFFDSAADVLVFRWTIAILSLGLALSFPVRTVLGVVTANLRFDIAGYIDLGKLLARTLLIVVFLKAGYSILALAVITVSVDLAGSGVLVGCAKRLAPWMTLSSAFFHRPLVRTLLIFGFFTFLVFISNMLRFQVDNLVIAGYLDLSRVTHYNIASRLTEYCLLGVVALFGVVTPVFTRLHAQGDSAGLKRHYSFVLRLSVLVAGAACCAAIIFGDSFIGIWMGPEYGDAYYPLAILMGGIMLGTCQTPSIGLFYALAKHRFFALLSLSEGLTNLLLSLVLVRHFGIVGVALGTTIPLLITKLLFQPVYTCRLLEIKAGYYYRSVFGLLLLVVALQTPLALFVRARPPESYFEMVKWAAVYYPVAGLIAVLIAFSRSERGEMLQFLAGYLGVKKGREV